MLPSTLDMVPSPSTWNPRPSTLDKKIDSLVTMFLPCFCLTVVEYSSRYRFNSWQEPIKFDGLLLMGN